jgi:hypothetical protein
VQSLKTDFGEMWRNWLVDQVSLIKTMYAKSRNQKKVGQLRQFKLEQLTFAINHSRNAVLLVLKH